MGIREAAHEGRWLLWAWVEQRRGDQIEANGVGQTVSRGPSPSSGSLFPCRSGGGTLGSKAANLPLGLAGAGNGSAGWQPLLTVLTRMPWPASSAIRPRIPVQPIYRRRRNTTSFDAADCGARQGPWSAIPGQPAMHCRSTL